MKQEPLKVTGIFSGANRSPLKILLYGKDSMEQRLIGVYFSQQTAREITTRTTDQISQAMVALERGEVDILISDIDGSDDSRYWLSKILENQLAPVILLSENESYEKIADFVPDNAVSWLCKVDLSRDELLQTVDSAILRWQSIRRNLNHRGELERLANFDQLTGLYNRRAVLDRLEECIAQARRYRVELSLLLIDVDYFEKAGAELGNITADAVLAKVAAYIKSKIRDADYIGRYGRDEFLIIFPNTYLDAAEIAAERIRKLVATLEIDTGQEYTYQMTVSGGLASYWPGDDVASFTHRAEDSLFRAKYHGRNCIMK